MFPWFWVWAPQLPFSHFFQPISPETGWSFGNISPDAGNGAIEQRIHEDIASYGRQLGLITEVLLPLAGAEEITPAQAGQSLQRLRAIHREIEALKAASEPAPEQAATLALEQLAQKDPQALARVLQRFAVAPRRLAAP